MQDDGTTTTGSERRGQPRRAKRPHAARSNGYANGHDHDAADQIDQHFRFFDTICGATQDRQDAVRKLLEKPLDLLLIVGGFNSSNTTHLAEISHGRVEAYHIEGADDIFSADEIRTRHPITGRVETRRGWLKPGVRQIGITSGASTPDVTLLTIIEKIVGLRAAQAR